MSRFLLQLLLLYLSIFLQSGCMEKVKQAHDGQLILNDHPMVGKIWDVRQGRLISQKQLLPRLLESKYLLLGETHDNIVHHEHQANMVAALANSKADASIHFEMIDDNQYIHFGLERIKSLPELMDKLKASESGWRYEQMYRVVFEQVLQAQFQYLPANLSREEIREIMKHGEEQASEYIRNLLSEVPLSSEQVRELEQEVIEDHCNALPATMASPMILAQRVRDARMSQGLLQSDKNQRVLIAGSGHVRNDRGVPMYLKLKDPQAKIVAIGFFEVTADKYSIDEYTARWGGGMIPFDFAWFTPRFDRKDPCEDFASMIKK